MGGNIGAAVTGKATLPRLAQTAQAEPPSSMVISVSPSTPKSSTTEPPFSPHRRTSNPFSEKKNKLTPSQQKRRDKMIKSSREARTRSSRERGKPKIGWNRNASFEVEYARP